MTQGNFIGVGGLVVRDNGYLLVRHTYGEYRGFWILPGGHVEAGEPLHKAVEREVLEETRIKAQSQGIVTVRSRRRSFSTTDCYIVFLMKYIEGEPISDKNEVDDARFFTFEELSSLDNVVVLSRIIVQEHARGNLRFLPRNTKHAPYLPDKEEAQLFM
jgi:ADP-ribose pyrophosphatase YjhB (NUDIX family)